MDVVNEKIDTVAAGFSLRTLKGAATRQRNKWTL